MLRKVWKGQTSVRPQVRRPALKKKYFVTLTDVERVRKEFVEEGLEAALERRKPRRTYLRVLDGEAEAHLIALAEQTMVHPAKGQRRVRLQDGRRVGRVQANV